MIKWLGNLFTKSKAEQAVARPWSAAYGLSPYNTPYPPDFSRYDCGKYFGDWSFSLTNINSKAVASIPLRLYARERSGRKTFLAKRVSHSRKLYLSGETSQHISKSVLQGANRSDFVEVLEGSPCLDLLERPNEWMTYNDFIMASMMFLQIQGDNFIAVTNNSKGYPEELVTLPSGKTYIIGGNIIEGEPFIKGYRVMTAQGGNLIFDGSEVMRMKLTSDPIEMYYGTGYVQAAWKQLDINKSFLDYQSFWYKNLARPDWLMVIGSGGKESANAVQSQINQRLADRRNAGKMVVVHAEPDEVSLERLTFPDKAIDGTRSSKEGSARTPGLETMASIWGVPLSKLFSNDPNRANASAGEYGYMKDTIAPFCRQIEDMLNIQYLPRWGLEDDAFFAFDEVIPKDRDYELRKTTLAINSGLLTKNEARKALDFEEVEDPMFDEYTSIQAEQPQDSTQAKPKQPTEAQDEDVDDNDEEDLREI